MNGSYKYCLEQLYELARVGEKYDLSGPQELNELLGNPLNGFESILVGGTNGKGSTSFILSTLLSASGRKVGLFTSPHLISFRERIRIDGAVIAEDDVCRLAERVLPLSHRHGFSFFETVWGMAASYFHEQKVDIVVWEVGLGGRLDATNVCNPVGSIVTNVGLDHTAILGRTREAIAYEKAAIFRNGRPNLTGDATSSALLQNATSAEVEFVPTTKTITPMLLGAHQQTNVSVARRLLEHLRIDVDLESLKTLAVPSRLELVRNFILDCAHNSHALVAIGKWISESSHPRPVEVVFGAMADKDVAAMAELVKGYALPVHLVEPKYPRRLELGELETLFSGHPILSRGDVASFLQDCRPDRTYLVIGSSFLAAEVKAALLGVDYPECGISTTAR